MALKSKMRLPQCAVEDDGKKKVFISVPQADLTPMYGEVLRGRLQANLLEVEVIEETNDAALVTWPIDCPCMGDACHGDSFWASKKYLI